MRRRQLLKNTTIAGSVALTGLASNVSANDDGHADPQLDPGGGGGGETIRERVDDDNFEVQGDVITLATSLEVYDPRWAPSIEKWEVDYAFGSVAVTEDADTGGVVSGDVWRQTLEISGYDDVGDFYSRDNEAWYGATSPNSDDMSDNDTLTSVLSLATARINPLIGASFTAAGLAQDFAEYIGDLSCSGVCDEWQPPIPQDELGVYRVYRRQIPEQTSETVEMENVAFGESERVAITDMWVAVGVGDRPSDAETVTEENKAEYNLSPIAEAEIEREGEVHISPDAEVSIETGAIYDSQAKEERRREIISENY
ncbi:hypothetical protein [Natrarchaeobaculum aegyptiacum]|uniref:hypothetical protein n=1 Tax=Natrarchaeobaculum aegyptiacum TaxID=745377 RepID=UPI001260392F|nr:hypothetical protein [Natrarchaeobaculum aegyptiacum]